VRYSLRVSPRHSCRALAAALVLTAPGLGGRGLAGESPLARLADALVRDITRVANGRPVELGPIDDRSSRGALVAADLHRLVAARLESRMSASDAGSRLRVEPVLSETPERLVVSARVVAEPGGELVDLLSVSVPSDVSVLPLTPAHPGEATEGVEILSRTETPPVADRVLAVALVADDRLAVLDDDAVALYRLEATSATLESRRPLPGPLDPVRMPGGLLVPSPDGSLWALTSRSPRAALLALDAHGRGLAPRAEAEAVPWPHAPLGLRFRPGTNLIDGGPEELGPGPWLALVRADLGVAPDGELRIAGRDPGTSGLRAGSAIAPLWPAAFALSAATPPDAADALRLVAREGDGFRTLASVPVPGPIRALATRPRSGGTRLVAAVEQRGGTTLLVIDLRPSAP
jgi:hypothetical protein